MKTLAPLSTFEGIRKDMERLFERFGDWEFPARSLGEWSPTVDLSDTKEAYIVKAEIPGMDPAEIAVSLENEALTLRGEKRLDKEEKGEQFYRTERSYGAFVRTVRLPGAVDGSKVTAGFKNGLLTVMLPKAPGAKGSVIPVKAE